MQKVLFHHIPKTAGTTLIEAMSAVYGDRTCGARYDYQITSEMIEDEHLAFYHGHFTRAVVETFRDKHPDAFIFTFVRHPFNRTISQYYNWQNKDRVRRELEVIDLQSPATDHRRKLREKFEDKIFDMTLDEFLQCEDWDIAQVADNLQCQYLTSPELPNYRRFNKAPLNALLSYDFVGLQELYVPCLRILEAKLDFARGSLGGSLTVNSNAHARKDGLYEVTPIQLAWLERKTSYDLALFHVCYSLLLRDYGDFFDDSAFDIDAILKLPVMTDPLDFRPASSIALTS